MLYSANGTRLGAVYLWSIPVGYKVWECPFMVDSFWRCFYWLEVLWCMVPCVLSLFRCDGNLWLVGALLLPNGVGSVRSCSVMLDSGVNFFFLGSFNLICVVVGKEGYVMVCRVLKPHLSRKESDVPPCVDYWIE